MKAGGGNSLPVEERELYQIIALKLTDLGQDTCIDQVRDAAAGRLLLVDAHGKRVSDSNLGHVFSVLQVSAANQDEVRRRLRLLGYELMGQEVRLEEPVSEPRVSAPPPARPRRRIGPLIAGLAVVAILIIVFAIARSREHNRALQVSAPAITIPTMPKPCPAPLPSTTTVAPAVLQPTSPSPEITQAKDIQLPPGKMNVMGNEQLTDNVRNLQVRIGNAESDIAKLAQRQTDTKEQLIYPLAQRLGQFEDKVRSLQLPKQRTVVSRIRRRASSGCKPQTWTVAGSDGRKHVWVENCR